MQDREPSKNREPSQEKDSGRVSVTQFFDEQRKTLELTERYMQTFAEENKALRAENSGLREALEKVKPEALEMRSALTLAMEAYNKASDKLNFISKLFEEQNKDINANKNEVELKMKQLEEENAHLKRKQDSYESNIQILTAQLERLSGEQTPSAPMQTSLPSFYLSPPSQLTFNPPTNAFTAQSNFTVFRQNPSPRPTSAFTPTQSGRGGPSRKWENS